MVGPRRRRDGGGPKFDFVAQSKASCLFGGGRGQIIDGFRGPVSWKGLQSDMLGESFLFAERMALLCLGGVEMIGDIAIVSSHIKSSYILSRLRVRVRSDGRN